jgi:hypothetical protein
VFLSKNKAQEDKSGHVWRLDINGRGEDIRKGGWWVNTVEMFYIHACKWKNETCQN